MTSERPTVSEPSQSLTPVFKRRTVIFLAVWILMLVTRLIFDGPMSQPPFAGGDVGEYRRVASWSIFNGHFWAGERTFLVPLIYKIFRHHYGAVIWAQVIFSCFAWSALVCAVACCFRNRFIRILSGIAVAMVALSLPVTAWDRTLLSESVVISGFALLLACIIESVQILAHGARRRPAHLAVLCAGIFVSCCLLAFGHDGNAGLPVLIAGFLLFILLVPGLRRQIPVRASIALIVVLLAIPALDAYSISRGQRWRLPMYDVLFMRIAPTPERLAFFEQRGLVFEDGMRRYVGKDPSMESYSVYNYSELRKWMSEKCRKTYAEFLLHHPRYVIDGVMDTRFQMDSCVSGYYSVRHYDGKLPKWARQVLRVFLFNGVWVLKAVPFFVLLLGGIAFRQRRGTWLFPLTLIWLWTSGLALYVIAVHGDACEVPRHCILAIIATRLAFWITTFYFVDLAVKTLRPPYVPTQVAIAE